MAGLSRRSGTPGSQLPRRQVRRSPQFTHSDAEPSLPTRDARDARRLVGRVGELAAIGRALDDLDRRAGFLQLSGDPGTGKTRLLTELASRARQRGIAVFSARSCDGARPVPFEPLIEALGDRMRAEPTRLRVGDTGAAGLAALFTGACDYPRADALTQPGARLALFSALRRWLTRISGDPSVLILDDAQWADPDTVDFLDYLGRHPVASRLLVAVGLRTRQAAPRLRSALVRCAVYSPVTRIELGPLDRAEAGQLIGLGPDCDQLDRLYRRSQGNPLCLLSLPATAPGADPDNAGRADATPLEELILGEIDTLSPQELAAASAAAVLGEVFPVDMLTAVAGLSPAALGAALTTLTRRDLLRSVPGRPELQFRHPMVRSVIYEHCEPSWRMLTHGVVLEELTRCGAPARIRARHIERHATSWQPSHFTVLVEAGEQELRRAPLAAAHWYGLAARRLPADPANDVPRFEARFQLARALGLAGRLGHSRNLLHQILRGTPDQPAASRIAAVAFCARVEQRLGRFPEALALLRREIAGQPRSASTGAIELRLELGLAGLLATEWPAVRDEAQWAIGAARQLGLLTAEAAGLALSAFGDAWAGRIEDARGAADAAAEMVDGVPDAALADDRDALVLLGWAEMLLERFTPATRHLDRARGILEHGGRQHSMPHLLIAQSLLGILTGRLGEARCRAQEAETVARALESDHLVALAVATSAPIAFWTAPAGGEVDALAAAEKAVTLRAPDSDWFSRASAAMLAHAALVSGDPYRCVELVTRAGGEGLAKLGACLVPMFTELLVEGQIATGDLAAAALAAGHGVRAAEQLGLPGQRGSAARALGRVLLAQGDESAAAQQFQLAAGCFAQAGRVADEVRAVALAGPVLARLGRRDDALRMLARSGELARSLGAGWAHARVEQAIGALAAPAPPTSGNPGLAPLTGRERQVADLIATGRSNREIAIQLRLSVRTVEAHLAHIYRKLDVTSRASLAVSVAAGRSVPGTPSPA